MHNTNKAFNKLSQSALDCSYFCSCSRPCLSHSHLECPFLAFEDAGRRKYFEMRLGYLRLSAHMCHVCAHGTPRRCLQMYKTE